MQWEFEFGVVLLSLLVLVVLRKSNDKIYRRFGLTFLAVLLFEYFTHPFWINTNLQSWAYLYLDVSWVITLCWTNLIVVSMALVDYLFGKYSELKRFFMGAGFLVVGGLYLEWIFLRLGIRKYHEVIAQQLASTYRIGNVIPVAELIYLPAMFLLITGFVKYWEMALDERRGKKKSIKGGGRK